MPLVSAPSMAARWPAARRSPARASQSATSAAKSTCCSLARTGAGVIVISQDLDELLELSDRFCALNEGRLSAPRPTEGLSVAEIGLMLGGAHGMEVAHVPA